MNGNSREFTPFPTLSTKAHGRITSGRSSSVTTPVGPKQRKTPGKARKVCSPTARLARATEKRAKCMEASTKLSGYFPKSKDQQVDFREPIVLSSDDGSPTPTQKDRNTRRAEGLSRARRYVELEAECESSEAESHRKKGTCHTEEDASEEEEGSPTAGGFIVPDDKSLSSDEGDSDIEDWADVARARRVPYKPGEKEREKERESDSESPVPTAGVEWSPCRQPPSPPKSPIRLDESTDVEEEVPMEEEEVIVEPGEEVVPHAETGKFHLKAQFLLLTYKSHLPKAEYVNFLRSVTNRPDAWVRLAHETGDSKCPYNHTHVVVDLTKQLNTTDVHKFCWVNPNIPNKVDKCKRIHPHIKRLVGTKAFRDAKIYISKEDPENKDLKALSNDEIHKGANLVEKIQSAGSLNVALRTTLRKLSDAPGIIQIFNQRHMGQQNVEIPPKPDKPWAVDLLEEVKGRCSSTDRNVIWYVDYKGKTGKTWVSKYLSGAYRDETGYDWLVLRGVKNGADAFQQIVLGANEGFRYKGFIVDITRGSKFNRELYGYLEAFKDGVVTCTKYQGCFLRFNTPWVIVFSNFWPQVEFLSDDRWDIRKIDRETGLATKLPYDAEAPEHYRHCKTCQCGNGNHFGRIEILQERPGN